MDSTERNESDVVTQAVARWRAGDAPDARDVLSAHPHLAQLKSVVIDLAYEEYCIRVESGQQIDPDQFCSLFPDVCDSLERLLEVHDYVARHSEVVGGPEVHWPRIGDTFLGFSLDRELGRGTFGRAYLARELCLGSRQVVLKLSSKGAAEAHTAGKLSHPNVVPIFSVQMDQDSGLTAICMPFLGEATLTDLLAVAFDTTPSATSEDLAAKRHSNSIENFVDCRRHPLNYVETVVNLGLSLAQALDYLHSRGVIHRDLKPSNVLLTNEGRPVLLDFNLAVDAAKLDNRLGGTLPYMSPEQIEAVFVKRSGVTIDHRSDLFSLGVILYQLLTGELPFPAESSAERDEARELRDRAESRYVPIRRRSSAIDGCIAEVVEECLQGDPERRPQSGAELASALRRCLSPARKAQRRIRVHRLATAWLIATAATMLIASLSWLAFRPSFETRAYLKALAYFEHDDFPGAVLHLTAAMNAAPPTAQISFARGMAYQMQGQFEAAIADYRIAASSSNAGVIQASLAYCSASLDNHTRAVDYARRALDNGYANGSVWNTLGYSLSRMGRLDNAKTAFDHALETDSSRAEPFQNRALTDFNLALRDERPLQTAIPDIEQAMLLAPQQWEPFYDAAYIYALSAQTHLEHRQRALECLTSALKNGASVANLQDNRLFAALRNEPEFELLSRASSAKRGSARRSAIYSPTTDPRL